MQAKRGFFPFSFFLLHRLVCIAGSSGKGNYGLSACLFSLLFFLLRSLFPASVTFSSLISSWSLPPACNNTPVHALLCFTVFVFPWSQTPESYCTLSQPSFCRTETALAIAPLLDPRDLISRTSSGRRPCRKTLGCPAARPVRGDWQSFPFAHRSAVSTNILRRSTQCACCLAVSAKTGSRRRVHSQQRFSMYVCNYVIVIVAVDGRGLAMLISPNGLSTLRLSSRGST